MDRRSAFGVPFGDLTLDDLRAALPPGEYEPLTWEAKGTKASREIIRRQVAGFANSREGGLLILGADQAKDTGAWMFEGVELAAEPIAWLDQVIRDGVKPVPQFDPRLLGTGPRGPVIAVLVWPVPDPPCITIDGQVFERVPGRTVPVSTPADLARLYQRGDVARERASTAAIDALARIRSAPPEQATDSAVFALTVAPTGLPDSLARAIFRESFVQALREAVRPFASSPARFVNARSSVAQHTVDVWLFGFNRVEGVYVSVDTGGAVAVGLTDGDGEADGIDVATSPSLDALSRLALRIVAMIGGYGASRLVVWARGRRGEALVARWITAAEAIESDELAGIQREVRRSHGASAWEPEE
jgi:hypothetical protein